METRLSLTQPPTALYVTRCHVNKHAWRPASRLAFIPQFARLGYFGPALVPVRERELVCAQGNCSGLENRKFSPPLDEGIIHLHGCGGTVVTVSNL